MVTGGQKARRGDSEIYQICLISRGHEGWHFLSTRKVGLTFRPTDKNHDPQKSSLKRAARKMECRLLALSPAWALQKLCLVDRQPYKNAVARS
jgi:hypothetical protein